MEPFNPYPTDKILRGAAHDLAREIGFVLNVLLTLAPFDAIERRLRDVNMLAFDPNSFIWRKKNVSSSVRNVRTIHIGVSHDDDFVVPKLGRIEIVFADAGFPWP